VALGALLHIPALVRSESASLHSPFDVTFHNNNKRATADERVAATAAAQLHPHLDSLLVGAAHVDVELGGCRRHLAYGSLHVLQAAQGRRVNAGRARDSTVRVRRGTRSPVAAIDAAAIAECRSRRCRCPSHDAAGAPRPACRRPSSRPGAHGAQLLLLRNTATSDLLHATLSTTRDAWGSNHRLVNSARISKRHVRSRGTSESDEGRIRPFR
jgi:hypothetical protein